jgi:hypothetical protein
MVRVSFKSVRGEPDDPAQPLGTAMKKILIGAAAAAGLLATTAPAALAHHSFAMFDSGKTVTVKGTVKGLEWTNPHVWLEISTPDGGVAKTYGFEGGAVAVLKRFGWTHDMVKVGDVVTLTSHPFRNGKSGGSLETVTLADGHTFKGGNGIPGAVVAGGAPQTP